MNQSMMTEHTHDRLPMTLRAQTIRFRISLWLHPWPRSLCRVQLMGDFADHLYSQFELFGTLSALDEALVIERNALQLLPHNDATRRTQLRKLARYTYARFLHLGLLPDLEETLALERDILELHPKEYPHRVILITNLADSLYYRFNCLGISSDLEEALALYRSSLELCADGHPLRSSAMRNIAAALHLRFEHKGTLCDLEEALSLQRSALEPEKHQYHAHSMENLARFLHSRFEQLGTLPDLEEALPLRRKVLGLYTEGHPDRARSMGYLVTSLNSRFEELGELSDLEEALDLGRDVLDSQRNLAPANLMGNLANSFHLRFKRLGAPSDLEDALSLGRRALGLYPEHTHLMGGLATFLYSRFERLGELSDLEQAVALQRRVMKIVWYERRRNPMRNLAASLRSRFDRLGELSDLEEAITLERDALELYPPEHPNRSQPMGSLAGFLHLRFQRLGNLSNLEEALALQREIVGFCSHEHPHRATSMGDLANFIYSRFKYLGELSDLEEALTLEREVLELCPQGHPDHVHSLGNLATFLSSRFKHVGTPSDLEQALDLQRKVLELHLHGHPQRARSLGKFAGFLHSRFVHLRELSDLEEALSCNREALEICPQEHPDRAELMGNLAFFLHSRFERLKELPDLEEALSLQRSVLEDHPQGHRHRANSMRNLAISLHSRYEHLGALSDLEEAYDLEHSVLKLIPEGHAYRPLLLRSIAFQLHARPGRFAKDLIKDDHKIYSELFDISRTASFGILQHGNDLLQTFEQCKHPAIVLTYQLFLGLIVRHLATVPSSLPQHLAILKKLISSTAVNAFSACIRYNTLSGAVELAEQGRGVFWNQLFRLRPPLDNVVASGDTGKRLAEKFTHLSSQLRSLLDAPKDGSRHDGACHLNIQLQEVVVEIRELPGLSRFLQSPLLSDLQVAASDGPVVIVNASQYSCDALIVLHDKDPIHVALPITKPDVSELSSRLHSLTLRARSRDVTKELLTLLRELWQMVVLPIVNVLQEFCPRGSRIWWCPTAEFSRLPLHAAGSFRKGELVLSDYYISSYTPTLTALIRARQKRQTESPIKRHHLLLVGQADAPGQCKLPSVNTELSNLFQRMVSSATVTCIQDQNATVTNVAEELARHEFVHIASHGIPDRKNPFASGFALGDGPLTVEKIMQYELRNAKFAYLSACHTTVGDEESPDEVIHLAAAMQFAGFRSVIGTMWAVDDAHTMEITSRFYNNMLGESGRLDHTRAALALHNTMRSLRTSNIPLDQRILYVHIGV